MAEALVLEFEGIGREQYEAVNERLGIDSATGAGDWPAGLQFHAGAETDDGMVVIEIWESREAQAAFMESRLGRALQEGGVAAPPARVLWANVLAAHHLAG
jgi:hypothetical protein